MRHNATKALSFGTYNHVFRTTDIASSVIISPGTPESINITLHQVMHAIWQLAPKTALCRICMHAVCGIMPRFFSRHH